GGDAEAGAVRPLGRRVLVVVGTRPEAIKMAPVMRALARHAAHVETRLALTGQHTTLVDQVLEAFGIAETLAYDVEVPPFDLNLMKPGQSLHEVVQETIGGLHRILAEYRPHLVLVQGDTATAFAASVAAFLDRTRVGHVEAGLRSYVKWAPFPEEIFRRLTDVIADYHFAPTPRAAAALRAEGIPEGCIHVTGNTVVDALQAAAALDRPVSNPALRAALETDGARLILLTAHRRESFGEPLRAIFTAVRELADRLESVRIVYPVHPNPNVTLPAREMLSDHPRITLTEPLDYFDIVAALRRARLVLTDSGGIQEEAPTFGTPVLVLRRVTERPEGVEAGVAELVGTDRLRILQRSVDVLARNAPREGRPNPYGDGRAGERIADILVSSLCGEPRRTQDWAP
ncbi:MAG TPA: UDP-N-acetylglucosamine 2-epimerase (non-hydrolyzing), partial [Longimicrobiales bacterium]|nr:UDP-N-acetylglucosamine 2-epimerase (non-hydrolyzing) [Longimicrobiales bacterium]